MSVIKIPALNPFRFHKVGVGDFTQNQIPFMEDQSPRYCQKMQPGDLFYIQFLIQGADLSGGVYCPQCTLIDNYGNTAHTFQVNGTSQAAVYTGYNAYNVAENIGTISDGVYFVKLLCYAPKDPNGLNYATMVFYSEPIYIKSTHDNTVLINYRLTYNDFDCIFTDDLAYFNLRVEGGVKSEGFSPGGKFQMFTDLDYQPVMLQSTPYNVYKWLFGPGYGLPNWMGDKLNRVFACDDILIDGVSWLRNEGAKLEANRESGYPFSGWAIELIKVEKEHSQGFDYDYLTFDSDTITFDSDLVTFDTEII